MHGVVARRRTAHFGLGYSYETRQVKPGTPMPEFLFSLRAQLKALTAISPEEFIEVLVSEYPAGAGIGWHRDAPAFGVVAGISLASACRMRLRPQPDDSAAAPRKSIVQILEPRSAYLLQGDVRWRWQHHIPPTENLRYSITYRTLRSK
jgi:alkylated DNA repair dioxygenase AlkB